MTQKLEQILQSQQKTIVLDTIKKGIIDFVGPKTVPELWQDLSGTADLMFIRDRLPLRDSARIIAAKAQEYILGGPADSGINDLLRVIQRNSQTELYPGSFADLGLPDPRDSEDNPRD